MEKERLDIILVNRGLLESREKAKSTIMAGVVYVEDERVDKPGSKFHEDVKIEIKGNPNPYVSRGGLKLEKAMKSFQISLEGKTAMDVGASTGGFTDCMLKNGAVRVAAIDVGYGQLAWELRNDPRVLCMERTNIRYVKPEALGFLADFVSIDVSFISLTKVLPVVKVLTQEDAAVVCLIKPQFEAGREKVGKHGVVRDKTVHHEVIRKIVDFSVGLGFGVKGLSFSPIKGPEGNIEYLLYIEKQGVSISAEALEKVISEVVEASHGEL